MRKKDLKKVYILLLLALIFSTGFSYTGDGTELFEAFPDQGLEVTPFEEAPLVFLENPKESGRLDPYDPKDPLVQARGQAMVSLRDAQEMMGEKTLEYIEEDQLVLINQLRRILMPLNKSIYLEGASLKAMACPPTSYGSQVYLPLRFVFEETGHRVNFNEEGQEIIIGKKAQPKSKIIPEDQISLRAIKGDLDQLKISQVFDFRQDQALGLAKDRQGAAYIFSLREDGQSQIYPLDFPGDLKTLFTSADGKRVYMQADLVLYGLNLENKKLKKIELPLQLEGVDLFGQYEDSFYGYKEGQVFSYRPQDKTVLKEEEGLLARESWIQGHWLVYQEEGDLVAYDLKDQRKIRIDSSRLEGAFKTLAARDRYLVYMDQFRNYYKVYDLEEDQFIYSQLVEEGQGLEVSLNSEGNLSLFSGGRLSLIQVKKGEAHHYDLINLYGSHGPRYYRWFSSGQGLVGIEERSYRNIFVNIKR
ncbi:MAG: stalk domain-containing protein [Tissierellia bacterium]|nr:stalk domain-containing protein [Tissierellia bacterium]